MAMTRKELMDLASAISSNKEKLVFGETEISKEEMKEALVFEIKQLIGGDYYNWQENKNLVFQLLAKTFSPMLPVAVNKTVGRFAKVENYSQNQKPVYTLSTGKRRFKRRITTVGLAGRYETFRLDKRKFDIATKAFGGEANITLERLLDGHEDLVELLDLIIEGIEDQVYEELWQGLNTMLAYIPAGNKETHNGFDSDKMKKLIVDAQSYGEVINIICFPEFAMSIVNDPAFVSDTDKADMRNQGYLGKFAGANVVVMPNAFVDETNTAKVFDSSMAIVAPSGKEGFLVLAFEGDLIIEEKVLGDHSRNITAYKKAGIAMLTGNEIFAYENTAI